MDKNSFLNIVKKRTVIIVTASAVTLVVLIGTSLCVKTVYDKNIVYKGLYIDNMDVSNLSKNDLESTVEKYYNDKLNNMNLIFKYEKFDETVNGLDIGASYDTKKISNEIFNTGKDGNVFSQTISRLSLVLHNKKTIYPVDVDEAKIDEYVKHVAKEINQTKKEPKVNFENSKVTLTEGKVGYTVDEKKLKNNILNALKSSINSNMSIDIPVEEVVPVLTQDIADKMTVLGSYSTSLSNSNAGRTKNIRLFIKHFSGTVLLPEDVFSADKAGGSREISDGYTTAKAFESGRVVDSVAGGICQGVSTLYNAVVYADLEIVYRQRHQFPVSYTEMGRDATLAHDSVDFKFKNNQNNPIIVQEYITDSGHVLANIWGINENPNKKIEIKAKQTGPRSSITYKYTYEDDKLISTDVLSKDTYNAYPSK